VTPAGSGKARQRRPEDMLPTLFGFALLVVSLGACVGQKTKGQLIPTNMDISSYAHARQRASANKESTFSFPVLEIFNQSGILIYSSHESMANAKVLKEFPDSVHNLPPQENATRLRNILDSIPDFSAREHEIIDGKKSVILSTDLEGCEGCKIQDQALDAVTQKILQQPSVAILEIHVSQP
jgi:hypothetical protein